MADASSARFNLQLTVTETLDLQSDNFSDPDVGHTISGGVRTIDASSTVPATKTFSDKITLSAGAATIDLTALVRTPLAAVDFTGLKVQLVKFKAASANTAVVIVVPGASNAYNLFGDSDGQVTYPAEAESLNYWADQLADVSSTVKNVDLSSTDLDAIIEVELVAG